MNTFLILLLVAAMGATLYVLVRGVMSMAQGKDASGEQQHQWMRKRVQFQALEPLAARLLALTQESAGTTGRELVLQLAAEIGHPRPEELIEPARSLFSGWMQRDVIVGTRAGD